MTGGHWGRAHRWRRPWPLSRSCSTTTRSDCTSASAGILPQFSARSGGCCPRSLTPWQRRRYHFSPRQPHPRRSCQNSVPPPTLSLPLHTGALPSPAQKPISYTVPASGRCLFLLGNRWSRHTVRRCQLQSQRHSAWACVIAAGPATSRSVLQQQPLRHQSASVNAWARLEFTARTSLLVPADSWEDVCVKASASVHSHRRVHAPNCLPPRGCSQPDCLAALTRACACSLDTNKLDAGMGGSVADVYDKDAWGTRLMEQDRLYQEALEAFTASQKPPAVHPAA